MQSEQDKIAALEKALAEAHRKRRVYDELIIQANQRYKTDIKKTLALFRNCVGSAGTMLRNARHGRRCSPRCRPANVGFTTGTPARGVRAFVSGAGVRNALAPSGTGASRARGPSTI